MAQHGWEKDWFLFLSDLSPKWYQRKKARVQQETSRSPHICVRKICIEGETDVVIEVETWDCVVCILWQCGEWNPWWWVLIHAVQCPVIIPHEFRLALMACKCVCVSWATEAAGWAEAANAELSVLLKRLQLRIEDENVDWADWVWVDV